MAKRLPLKGKKPPPVAERPRCGNCGQPLKPDVRTIWPKPSIGVPSMPTHREWTGDYDRYGYFCTMRCATEWANDYFPEVRKTKRRFTL